MGGNNVFNLFFSVGAFISCGILCSFFVGLNMIKQEFWNIIKENVK